jgi:hypothetical protein
MARDFLLNFNTVTKTKASGAGATTTFGGTTGSGATNADAPLNITPWVLTRDTGLFVKVMINLTGVTSAVAGTVQFQVRLLAATAIGGTYTIVHQTPSDAVFLKSTVGTLNTVDGKSSFEVYLPLTVPCGYSGSTNDVYNWFQVAIVDTLATATAAAATYTVHIVQGKDGSYS